MACNLEFLVDRTPCFGMSGDVEHDSCINVHPSRRDRCSTRCSADQPLLKIAMDCSHVPDRGCPAKRLIERRPKTKTEHVHMRNRHPRASLPSLMRRPRSHRLGCIDAYRPIHVSSFTLFAVFPSLRSIEAEISKENRKGKRFRLCLLFQFFYPIASRPTVA